MLSGHLVGGNALARMGKLPKNEFGFALCQLPNGDLARGPVSWGTPTSVDIQLQCPSGSKFLGLGHSHPGGVAYPSDQDIKSGFESNSQFLAIQSDSELRIFPLVR